MLKLVKSRYDEAHHIINLSGLSLDDKAEILYQLAEVSALRASFNNNLSEATIEDCKEAVKNGYVDYFFDRCIKVDFSTDNIDISLYDRDSGKNTAWTVIKGYLRSTMDQPKEYLFSWSAMTTEDRVKYRKIISDIKNYIPHNHIYVKAYENIRVWSAVVYEKGYAIEDNVLAVQGDAEDEPHIISKDIPQPKSNVCQYPMIMQCQSSSQYFAPYDGLFINMEKACLL